MRPLCVVAFCRYVWHRSESLQEASYLACLLLQLDLHVTVAPDNKRGVNGAAFSTCNNETLARFLEIECASISVTTGAFRRAPCFPNAFVSETFDLHAFCCYGGEVGS